MADDQFMPHLRTLPDGSLTAAEICLLLDHIEADARRLEACDAEMDRLNCALVDALAERDAALARIEALEADLDGYVDVATRMTEIPADLLDRPVSACSVTPLCTATREDP